MGRIYHLNCTKCGWTRDLCLGIGAGDRRYANEVLLNLESGPKGLEISDLLFSAPDAELRLERALYHCRACGRDQMRLRACITNTYADVAYSCQYFCKECGKLLSKVRDSDIRKRPCPECGGELKGAWGADWEIGPRIECMDDPTFPPHEFVPLASECIPSRDSKGRAVYIPIKSEIQRRRLMAGARFEPRMLSGLDEARDCDGGYWALTIPSLGAVLATFPAALIRVEADVIHALERELEQKLADELHGARLTSAYFEAEPLNIVRLDETDCPVTYGLWTQPALTEYADALRGVLHGRHKLDIRR